MPGYTVHFQYAYEHVTASDSDMAAMKARAIIEEQGIDPGELIGMEIENAGIYTTGFMPVPEALAEIRGRSEEPAPAPLPPRRGAGLTLSHDDGELYVTFFGYSSSLLAAANEGELLSSHRIEREPYQLNPRQQAVVDTWMDREADYLSALS